MQRVYINLQSKQTTKIICKLSSNTYKQSQYACFLNADVKEANILNINQILHLIDFQKSLPSRQLLFKIWDKQNMANLKVKILTWPWNKLEKVELIP